MLYQKYHDRGFVVLAFPSNDFRQEFETNEQINSFLEDKFPQVDFPVFGVSSLRTNPVFQLMRRHLPDQPVRHNFFKYLVGKDGIAVDLYPKQQDPIFMESGIEELLEEKE